MLTPRRLVPALSTVLLLALTPFVAGCGSDDGVAEAPAKASSAHGTLPVADRYASRDVELHLRVKATRVRGKIAGQEYEGMQTYETEVVDGKGELTEGTASEYIGPTWQIQPGDELTIDYVNDLEPVPFTPVSTGKPEMVPQPLNLHTHGLTVAPNGNSDNVLLNIPPGRSNRFEIKVPEDHHHGLYWYHPHIHGMTDDLVYSGLAGNIVVGRADGNYEQFDDLPVHELMVRYNVRKPGPEGELIDASPWNTKGTALEPRGEMIYTVNGEVAPEIAIGSGDPESGRKPESQIWGLTNVTGSASYIVALEEVDKADAKDPEVVGKPLDLTVVSVDGTPMEEPVVLSGKDAARGYLLGQGGRASILAQGPSEPSKAVRLIQVENRSGTGRRSAYDWPNRKFGGGWRDYSRDVLAVSTENPDRDGRHVATPAKLTTHHGAEIRDLSGEEVDYRRTYVYDNVTDPTPETPNNFPIDGELFPNNRVEQPRAGTVEEWTVLNHSPLHHPFHVHTQFAQSERIIAPEAPRDVDGGGEFPTLQQVTDLNQRKPNGFTQDVINLPPAGVGQDGMPLTDGQGAVSKPGVIVLRAKFEDYLGTYVQHCHRLPHEDRGMMSLVRTIPGRPVYGVAAGDRVIVRDGSDHSEVAVIEPNGSASTGGFEVAVGDVDRDAVPDVAVSRATEDGAVISVYSGASGYEEEIRTVKPFGDAADVATPRVALGDLNADGHDEVIAGAGAGDGSRIVVSDGASSGTLADFDAYDSGSDGVTVAAGMVEEGGRISLITGSGTGDATIKVFNFDLFGDEEGAMPDIRDSIEPIEVGAFHFGPEGYRGGVNVAVGYPFAADGGFASIVGSSMRGTDGQGRGRVISYRLRGHGHSSEDVGVSGIARPHVYDPAGKRRAAQIQQTILPDGPANRIGLVSTPAAAKLIVADDATGRASAWEADRDGGKLKPSGRLPGKENGSVGGL